MAMVGPRGGAARSASAAGRGRSAAGKARSASGARRSLARKALDVRAEAPPLRDALFHHLGLDDANGLAARPGWYYGQPYHRPAPEPSAQSPVVGELLEAARLAGQASVSRPRGEFAALTAPEAAASDKEAGPPASRGAEEARKAS